MTWAQVKNSLKGCKRAVWQEGADTNDETTARKAHAMLSDLIAWAEPCDIARAVRLGDTLYIVSATRADWEAGL